MRKYLTENLSNVINVLSQKKKETETIESKEFFNYVLKLQPKKASFILMIKKIEELFETSKIDDYYKEYILERTYNIFDELYKYSKKDMECFIFSSIFLYVCIVKNDINESHKLYEDMIKNINLKAESISFLTMLISLGSIIFLIALRAYKQFTAQDSMIATFTDKGKGTLYLSAIAFICSTLIYLYNSIKLYMNKKNLISPREEQEIHRFVSVNKNMIQEISKIL